MFWIESKNNLDLEGCVNFYLGQFCGQLTKEDVEIETYKNGDVFVIKKDGSRGETFRFNKENGRYYESKLSALMVNVDNSILQNDLQKAVQFMKRTGRTLKKIVEKLHQVYYNIRVQ